MRWKSLNRVKSSASLRWLAPDAGRLLVPLRLMLLRIALSHRLGLCIDCERRWASSQIETPSGGKRDGG